MSSSHASSWSEVPVDILVTVLDGLGIRDLFRSGAVCRCWNNASSYVQGLHRVLSRSQRTPPCLVYKASNSGAATLYSITDNRSYAVPCIPGGFWLGASHGWLITADDHAKLRLVNPVTGQRIESLPLLSTIEQVRLVYDDNGTAVPDKYQVFPYDRSLWVHQALVNRPFIMDAPELVDYLYLRALISSDPSSDGSDCVVVLIHRPRFQLSFARPGDAYWTWIQAPPDNTEYCDCAFDGGTLYAMRYDGAIHAFDLHGRPALERQVILRPQVKVTYRSTNYLIHAPWLNCWLQVWRKMEESTDPAAAAHDCGKKVWKTKSIKVYQVDLVAQTLVETKDLGEHALFVGSNYSFSLSSTDCPDGQPNHVYYTDNEEHYALYTPQCPRDIGVYNMGDGSFHHIQPPCPWSNWPLPSWITPSLASKTALPNN
ncbi:hypothetical protein QOZ80_6AG0547120 [Eleusine coracana subsp. coracana]|nr:hypothetical protein QOZ80_6AG0547120 [Eleusine coracana subsp. coracana]